LPCDAAFRFAHHAFIGWLMRSALTESGMV
jgi:hypothetical protein